MYEPILRLHHPAKQGDKRTLEIDALDQELSVEAGTVGGCGDTHVRIFIKTKERHLPQDVVFVEISKEQAAQLGEDLLGFARPLSGKRRHKNSGLEYVRP